MLANQAPVYAPPFSNKRLIFQLPPVYDAVFRHLSPLDLIHVSKSSKSTYNAIHHYLARAFSINRLLARFFEDPRAFRSLQALTGTLISGSQALQFFSRTFWVGSDLDIYTQPTFSLQVGKWLETQGYHFTPSSKQHSTFVEAAGPLDLEDVLARRDLVWDPRNAVDVKHEQMYKIIGIRSVFGFEKQVGSETLKIQIIAARLSPFDVILNFHSTAVMNFISWNKAYCLYPYATLQKSRSLTCFVPESPCPRYDRAIKKYHERGFTMVADIYMHEDPRCVFRPGPRFVGDAQSWIIPLDTNGVIKPDLSSDFDAYLINGWEVRKMAVPTNQFLQHYALKLEMSTAILQTSVLRNTYTAPKDFLHYVLPFFIGQGKLEHAKLSRAETIMYGGILRPKPGFWKFYDEELAEILHQWILDGMPSVSEEE